MALNRGIKFAILFLFGFTASDAKECPNNLTAYGSSCYLFGQQLLSFYSAENYCNLHDAHLVHINDVGENTFIREHVRSLTGINWWIGLTDDEVENTWIWHDTNEKAMYTDWVPGQPDNARHNEDCAEFDMRSGYNGHWNDAPCDAHLLPICELPLDEAGSGIVG